MDKMTMERLEHRLCAELDEIAGKQGLSAGDLDVVDKATHALKSMCALKAGGASKAGDWSGAGEGSMYSGARGMAGRSMDYSPYGGDPYASRYAYADGPDAMRDELRTMMDSGKLNVEQREAAHKLMDALTK